MLPEQVFEIKRIVEQWVSDQDRDDPEPVHILVAWHVIHTSTGAGNISDDAIYSSIDWLNQTFQPYFIAFVLDSIDRTENEDWFNNWYGSASWAGMNELAIDPYHYLNAYSANLWIDGIDANGWAYMGQAYGPSDYRQCINLAYQVVQWAHDTATHETGHHLGLSHTFENDCTYPNDGVDDTPQMHSDYNDNCDDNQDSCPNDEGNDPVHNYMNYTSQSCRDNFTQGQDDLMSSVISSNHYGYYENEFRFPSIQFNSINVNQDSDGDGVINPGETASISISITNAWGLEADGVLLTLSSEDERLIIMDSIVQFEEPLIPGETSSGPVGDYFQVYAEDGDLGFIDCNLNVNTANEEYPYNIDIPFEIRLSLDQYGFPINSIAIKSSPVLTDIDNNLIGDIFFGAENGKLYGYMVAGIEIPGFPYSSQGDIRTSPAVKDIDLDGTNEITFGTTDGKLIILDASGTQEIIYTVNGNIYGAPAITDLDSDGDQEVIAQMGGFYEGDRFQDAIFENPGFGNHWLKIKLVGKKSNRSGIGARIHVVITEDGKKRSVYKHVNSGGSFGANPLCQTIGLGKASQIDRIEVYWPTTGETQTFTSVPMDQRIEITEGKPEFRILDTRMALRMTQNAERLREEGK